MQCRAQSSVGSIQDFRPGVAGSIPGLGQTFFPRINDNNCDRIQSSFNLSVVSTITLWESSQWLGKYCAEYWLKELQESMDRCTGRCDISVILLGTALNIIQSINQSSSAALVFGDSSRIKSKGPTS